MITISTVKRRKSFCFAKLLFLYFVTNYGITAQIAVAQIDTLIVTENTFGKDWIRFIKQTQDQTSVIFFYKTEWLKGKTIQHNYQGHLLSELINSELERLDLSALYVHNVIVFVNGKEIQNKSKLLSNEPDLLIIGDGAAQKGDLVEVYGRIVDGARSEPLVGAQVFVRNLQIGATTDENGHFSMKLPVGRMYVELSYVGYETKVLPILVTGSGEMNAELFTETLELEEVFVNAQVEDNNVKNSVSGMERLTVETIKKIPTFMGEIDPIKSMISLPGVTNQGDVSSGFTVRGGETGQNMIIQDGAVIYNPSHMFGFFTAFNPEIINDMVLYKGGGPANYGGRISSILHLKLKKADTEKMKASGGVGIVSSRLTLETPVRKGSSSLLVSGRTSYTKWMLNAFPKVDPSKNKSNFYDIYTKYYQKIGQKDQLSFSFYRSDDEFKISSDTANGWVTQNFTAQWDKMIGDDLLVSIFAGNSNYESGTWDEVTAQQFQYKNGISNWQQTTSLFYNLSSSYKIVMGYDLNYVINAPGKLIPKANNFVTEPYNAGKQYSLESALFANMDWELSTRWSFSAGLRFSWFQRLGAATIYNFKEPARQPIITDSVRYQAGERIIDFSGWEPRLSARYSLTSTSSIKLSFYKVTQYMHLISNSVSLNPLDYWIASGPEIQPQRGNQFSIGYFKNFKDKELELSVEAYYKHVDKSVDYIEGAEIKFNKYIESNLIQGIGKSYGLEIMLKKMTGKINGWITYTYSRSLRKFDSDLAIQTVNEGRYYPANLDKPHDLSMVMSYDLGRRLLFSANFVYSTGRPITVPISKFSYDKKLSILTYSDRNAYRIPDYHRLDLSVTIREGLRKKQLLRGEWVLSLYNVYARKNVHTIFFNHTGYAYQVSVLGTVFPSISYNFKF